LYDALRLVALEIFERRYAEMTAARALRLTALLGLLLDLAPLQIAEA
jgi:hypothetical protein